MTYLLLMIPGMLLMAWAQWHVKGTYYKYAEVASSLGMTGAEVAQSIWWPYINCPQTLWDTIMLNTY